MMKDFRKYVNPLLVIIIVNIFFISINSVNKEIRTSTDPQEEKIVVLDAGHGGEDGGAISENRNIRS